MSFTTSLSLSLALVLPSSMPVPVGGSLNVLVHRSPPSNRPFVPGRALDLLTAAQVLEPVLEVDGGPSLARVLESDATHLVLELAPGGYLGERALGPADLIRHLNSLARPDGPSAHSVLPIKGALARIGGESTRGLELELDDGRVRVTLAEPYPHAAALLTTLASAGPEQLRPPDAAPTSGAFRIPSYPAFRLVPEIQHRQGRPFLDELLIQRVQTTFGLRTELRRRAGVVTFGVPGQTGPDAARTVRLSPLGHAATEVVFLRAGQKSDLPIDILHSIGAALPRERLAEREWPGETLPAPSVRLGADGVLVVERRLSAPRTAILSYLEEEGPGRRLIERLQLDLLRLGVSARLEPLDLKTFEARKQTRSFDLLVESVTLEGSVGELEIHEFHRLLALAAYFGVLPRVINPVALANFARANTEDRRRDLVGLERELLRAARVVPLVRRDLETRASPNVEGIRMRSFGLPELGNALFSPTEPKN